LGAPVRADNGTKIDRGVVQADVEPRKIEELAGKAVPSPSESEATSRGAYTNPEKIVEASREACTETPFEEQGYSFQTDTSRVRRRRRRVVSSILGTSARLLSSGWVGRLVSSRIGGNGR